MIDITTYRMRIGCFSPPASKQKHRRATTSDCGTWKQKQNEPFGFIIQVVLLVLVIQIRMHLIISGDVEQNPGPITQNGTTQNDTTPAQDIPNNLQGNQK